MHLEREGKSAETVAFEYPTVDDLLASYTRLKNLGIVPVLTTDTGPTTAFYYEDPDGNSVELLEASCCGTSARGLLPAARRGPSRRHLPLFCVTRVSAS